MTGGVTIFSPKNSTGWQVYQSFSDDALLDILIRTMQRPGHSPHYDEVYPVYLEYIKIRFSSLNQAKKQARLRIKRLLDETRWPVDWPDRVDPEPFLKWLQQRHGITKVQSFQFVRQLCAQAKETGLPPSLSDEERRQLEKVGGVKRAFELMGIPKLNHSALHHMTQFWQEQKKVLSQNTPIK